MGRYCIISAVALSIAMIGACCACGGTHDAANAPASSSSLSSSAETATPNADNGYHVLPDYQVKRLQSELRDFPVDGTMIESAGPAPSYLDVNGAHVTQTMQNETKLDFRADKSYTLIAMCTGEGGANVEWRFGVQLSRQHLDCRPYSDTRYMNAGIVDMGVTGIGADTSVVTITPDNGTKAEIAYRIDESDAPGSCRIGGTAEYGY